jgi:hypothetical protein
MRRASPLLAKALLLFVASVAASTATAANNSAASDAAKRPSNSFNLYVLPPPGTGTVVLPTQGVGVASSKAVITDPYKVPLIQNAGSLTPGR